MRASQILLTLSIFGSTLALPRTITGRGDSDILYADCATGAEPFTAEDLIVAADAGSALQHAGRTVGVGAASPQAAWPVRFANTAGTPQLAAGPWFVFPLLRSRTAYAGGAVDAERVLFNAQGQISGVATLAQKAGQTTFTPCAISLTNGTTIGQRA